MALPLVGPVLLVLAAWAAPAARAADSVYWTNAGNNTISFANLDGSGGGGQLDLTGATPFGPRGVAIDPAAGRIYWANGGNDTISFANLDGSGGGQLSTAGATVSSPFGVAIDPAAGRIYWANFNSNTVSFANLDGSGGGQLSTTGATLSGPFGLAIDSAAGRIYWANASNSTIFFANLDGSGGGGQLSTAGATVSAPRGVAIDAAAGRIYWANIGNNTISFANLDGSGGGQLSTAGATLSGPRGVAIDPAAGRIYWANFGNDTISFANLDGSGGGGQLSTAAAAPDDPNFPALLKAPAGAGAPAISGGGQVGQPLSCGQGAWAPDLLGSFLYRAPQSFAHQWLRDGAEVPGAASSAYTPTEAGNYTCRVTAANQAGSSPQTSAGVQVLASNAFRFGKLIRNKKKGNAFLEVIAPGPGQIGYRGQGEGAAAGGSGAATVSRRLDAAGPVRLKIKAGRFGKRSKEIRRQLKRTGRAKVRITVTFVPWAGTADTKPRKLTLIRN